jgi:hypothetical protein
MGKGNVCVHGEYEGLYYIDWNNFSSQYDDEDGTHTEDYDFQRDEWETSLYEFKAGLKKKYNSFTECDEWINRDERAVLENSLFYIVVEDNEWSMAIKLVQKEQDYYSRGNIVNLQAGLYKKYLNGMKDVLFEQFEELGVYGGAWTSGTIKKSA